MHIKAIYRIYNKTNNELSADEYDVYKKTNND
jgi:hypothetical protein